PTRVGSGKALLRSVGVVLGDVAAEHFPQQQLSVARLVVVSKRFRPGLILVQLHDFVQIPQLVSHRQAQREVDQIVVEKRHSRLEAVGHAQLVFDDQQSVQESLDLNVQQSIDVIGGRAGL